MKTISRFNSVLLVPIMSASVFMLAWASAAHADILTRQLEVGSRGADVGSLQTFLASDPTLYPQGLVTSYFGFLTKAAVSNFQSRNGLPAVGRVGPMTLPVINAQMGGVSASSESAPFISSARVSISRNSAEVMWATNELAKGVVYYSTAPISLYERTNSADVSGSAVMTDANFRATQNVLVSGLQANTTYYYVIYTTDQTGNVSLTWPSSFRTTN